MLSGEKELALADIQLEGSHCKIRVLNNDEIIDQPT